MQNFKEEDGTYSLVKLMYEGKRGWVCTWKMNDIHEMNLTFMDSGFGPEEAVSRTRALVLRWILQRNNAIIQSANRVLTND